MLRSEQADLILNDQRRAFSDEYVNLILTTCTAYVEVSAFSPLAARREITPEELKNHLCILISSASQRETEQEYDCRRHADLVVHDGARRSDFSA